MFILIFIGISIKYIRFYKISKPKLYFGCYLTFKTSKVCLLLDANCKFWQIRPTQFPFLLMFSFKWSNFGKQLESESVPLVSIKLGLVLGLRTPNEGTNQWYLKKMGQCGRQNMLRPYLKIWEWEWIFGHAVKAISSGRP